MPTLLEAIKNNDVQLVRKLIRNEPSLIKAPSDFDLPPLQFAKEEGKDFIEKVGIKRIEVALLLAIDWSKFYSIDELRVLLVDLISELSEDCYSAGWLSNIEYELWELINETADNVTLALWMKRGDMEAVADLRKLKEITHSWAFWDEGKGNAVPINLEQWYRMLKSG